MRKDAMTFAWMDKMSTRPSSDGTLKICVAGPGAIGTTLAALLGAGGQRVTVIARGESLKKIASSGVTLRQPQRELHADVFASDGNDIGIHDVLLLCSKAQDLETLALASRNTIGPNTLILPVVNGIPWWYFHGVTGRFAERTVQSVDPDGALANLLPPEQTIGVVASFTAERMGPGKAVALNPIRMVLGEIDDISRNRTHLLVEIFNRCGIETRLSSRIRDPLWTKVTANLMSNPLSVVAGAPLKHVCGREDLSSISRKLIDEAMLVAASFSARLEVDPDGLLQFGAGMGDAKTSMLQDYESGRQLELEAICEAVLELASMQDIAMPLTKYISSLARYRSEAARSVAS